METLNPIIDTYINKAPDFAKPILTHFRKLVHDAIPEVKETIKWGHVHFDLKSPVCYMAAFKQHCRLGFWHSGLLPDPEHILHGVKENAESPLNRITVVGDLPAPEILTWYLKNAAEINRAGIKPLKTKPAAAVKTELITPDDFEQLLYKHPTAKEYFDAFSHTKQKEYLAWFADAKTEATRQKRINTALEGLAEGKSKNWKYQ